LSGRRASFNQSTYTCVISALTENFLASQFVSRHFFGRSTKTSSNQRTKLSTVSFDIATIAERNDAAASHALRGLVVNPHRAGRSSALIGSFLHLTFTENALSHAAHGRAGRLLSLLCQTLGVHRLKLRLNFTAHVVARDRGNAALSHRDYTASGSSRSWVHCIVDRRASTSQTNTLGERVGCRDVLVGRGCLHWQTT
jgi:hypothetical protein